MQPTRPVINNNHHESTQPRHADLEHEPSLITVINDSGWLFLLTNTNTNTSTSTNTNANISTNTINTRRSHHTTPHHTTPHHTTRTNDVVTADPFWPDDCAHAWHWDRWDVVEVLEPRCAFASTRHAALHRLRGFRRP
jgi:hypothetical protein